MGLCWAGEPNRAGKEFSVAKLYHAVIETSVAQRTGGQQLENSFKGPCG